MLKVVFICSIILAYAKLLGISISLISERKEAIMSSSLKKRIISTLLITVFNFLSSCVIWKLFYYKENWLELSLIYSITWGIGHFLRKMMNEHEEFKILGDAYNRVEAKLILIVCCGFLVLFFGGVILEISNIYIITAYIVITLTISLFIL